ncbi:MAG TPA: MFS transporter [Bacteroidales bacterium]|nr:MFS transporter [Bacteroidales bacterium]
MKEEFTGLGRLLAYSAGMAGWSILMNTISVMIIYFYLPPDNSGLPVLIPNKGILGIFTMFSLILASGRLIDAVTDPLIAWFSDRTRSKRGRRIPFMMIAVVPSVVFCVLLFFPLQQTESTMNYMWLFVMQSLFYIFLTMYIVPFNALMPELARDKEKKLRLSTLLSFMFVAGIIIASQIPQIATSIDKRFSFKDPQESYQLAILIVVLIGMCCMMMPLFVVDENKYCNPVASRINLFRSLHKSFSNRRFMIFLAADASFFITLALVSSGILYYVSVLLGLPEKLGSFAMAMMILLSLLFYPAVIRLASRYGKKRLIILSFLIFSLLFLFISGMGKYGLSAEFQLYLIGAIASFPVAVLGILPYALVAEMADEDAAKSGEKTEGMYFAIRTFADKLGQTLGVMGFAICTLFGRDPGNDMGIRLSAWAGFAVCVLAAAIFTKFRE